MAATHLCMNQFSQPWPQLLGSAQSTQMRSRHGRRRLRGSAESRGVTMKRGHHGKQPRTTAGSKIDGHVDQTGKAITKKICPGMTKRNGNNVGGMCEARIGDQCQSTMRHERSCKQT